MRFGRVLVSSAAAILMFATNSYAAVINGSFETGGPAANNATTVGIGDNATIFGWTVINNDGSTTNNGHNVLYIGNGGFGISTPFGVDFLDLTGTSDVAPFDGVSQAVATTLGQKYNLSFYLGVNAAGGNNGGTGGTFGPPISVDVSAGTISQLFLDAGTSGTKTSLNSLWTPYNLSFTATSTTTNLSFVGETGVQFVGLDNVSLDPVSGVPEPSTWLMMLLGFGSLGYFAYRRSIEGRATPTLAA